MARDDDTVVLLPGLWVHAAFMKPMQRRIERRGYRVFRFAYPSMRGTLTENARALARYCETLPGTRLHFVGHSMGGLVIVHAVAQGLRARLARVVLVGTPFAASFAARRLARLPGGSALLGKCMPQWLDDARPAAIGGCEIGVIAGDLGLGLGRLVAPDLPRPNDGVVQVKETAVPGMRDHVVLHVSHTAMLFSRRVADEICAFIADGRFDAAGRR